MRLGVPFVVQEDREDSWDQGHGVRRLVVQIHLTACIKSLTSAPRPQLDRTRGAACVSTT